MNELLSRVTFKTQATSPDTSDCMVAPTDKRADLERKGNKVRVVGELQQECVAWMRESSDLLKRHGAGSISELPDGAQSRIAAILQTLLEHIEAAGYQSAEFGLDVAPRAEAVG